MVEKTLLLTTSLPFFLGFLSPTIFPLCSLQGKLGDSTCMCVHLMGGGVDGVSRSGS